MPDVDKSAICHTISDLEKQLKANQIDNFHIGRRKFNARRKHCGSIDFEKVPYEKLKDYEQYLIAKGAS